MRQDSRYNVLRSTAKAKLLSSSVSLKSEKDWEITNGIRSAKACAKTRLELGPRLISRHSRSGTPLVREPDLRSRCCFTPHSDAPMLSVWVASTSATVRCQYVNKRPVGA